MPHKSSVEVVAVWIMTGIANIISWFVIEVADYLPIIKDIVSIISVILAVGYTLYKWKKDWVGINPKRKNR